MITSQKRLKSRFVCVQCGGPSGVIETRTREPDRRLRRRECETCGFRFTTYETPYDISKEDFTKISEFVLIGTTYIEGQKHEFYRRRVPKGT